MKTQNGNINNDDINNDDIKNRWVNQLAMALALTCVFWRSPLVLAQDCQWEFSPEKTKVKWTAFKTTDKAAVDGAFTDFSVAGSKKGRDPLALLKNLSFTISTDSVDTQNPGRDQTIEINFFQKMTGDTIRGFVESMGQKDSGDLIVRLAMNGTSRAVPMCYALDRKKGTFKANGAMNVLSFRAHQALDQLNQSCFELHKGEDGVSKTWADVEIALETQFNKQCP